MRIALQEAQKAFDKDEIPIGAVIVHEGQIIGKGYNLVETLQDPTAHAELLAITAAANVLASWRLDDTILYTTLEPCPMCAGAILLARIPLVVYAAKDPRLGACGSVINVLEGGHFDIGAQVVGDVMGTESRELLQRFFVELRRKKNDSKPAK